MAGRYREDAEGIDYTSSISHYDYDSKEFSLFVSIYLRLCFLIKWCKLTAQVTQKPHSSFSFHREIQRPKHTLCCRRLFSLREEVHLKCKKNKTPRNHRVQ